MKRFLSILLACLLVVGLFAGCGEQDSDSKKEKDQKETEKVSQEKENPSAMAVVDSFVKAVEKREIEKGYKKYVTKDQKKLLEDLNYEFLKAGQYFQVDYDQVLVDGNVLFAKDAKVSMEKKEVLFETLVEDKQFFYISYYVKRDMGYEAPREGDCVVEFVLSQSKDQWLIESMRQVNANADFQVLAMGKGIVEGSKFRGGVAFIRRMDQNYNYDSYYTAIDSQGKELFRFENMEYDMIYGGFYYENGIMAIEDKIYDMTGQVIASPDTHDYDFLASDSIGGYVLAVKYEESIDGDTQHVGVLDNQGKWLHPLSADHPILKAGYYVDYGSKVARQGDTVMKDNSWNAKWCYDPVENKLVDSEYTYSYTYQVDYSTWEYKYGIYRYDAQGNSERIVKDVKAEVFLDEVFLGRPMIWSGGNYELGGFKLYDYEGNELMDLSAYTILESEYSYNGDKGVCYVDGKLLCTVDNGSGGYYACLFGGNGNKLIEPIRLEGDDYYTQLSEDGFVYVKKNDDYEAGKVLHYDLEGNEIEFKNVKYIGENGEGLYKVQNHVDQIYYVNAAGEKVVM